MRNTILLKIYIYIYISQDRIHPHKFIYTSFLSNFVQICSHSFFVFCGQPNPIGRIKNYQLIFIVIQFTYFNFFILTSHSLILYIEMGTI